MISKSNFFGQRTAHVQAHIAARLAVEQYVNEIVLTVIRLLGAGCLWQVVPAEQCPATSRMDNSQ